VHQTVTVLVLAPEHRATRVSAGARLDLCVGIARGEIDGESHWRRCSRLCAGWRLTLRPLHMPLAGSVTGLTAHVDARVAGAVGRAGSVVVLMQVGRMAFGAHVVPVL